MHHKERIKKNKKQLAIQILCVVLISVFGVISGFYFGNVYILSKLDKVDYSQFSEELLLDDPLVIQKKAKNKTPASLTATECFVLAEYNLNTAENFVMEEIGNLSHIDSQSIYAYHYKYNGVRVNQDISKGKIKSVATKMVAVGDDIKLYSGKVNSKTEASWSDKFRQYTAQSYKDLVGSSPDQNIPYIVSSKTMVSESAAENLGNGQFGFSIDLNTSSSVLRYVKQIRMMSNINDLPVFQKMNVYFVIDSNFNFVSIETDEKYSINYSGIPVVCEGRRDQSFDFVNPPVV